MLVRHSLNHIIKTHSRQGQLVVNIKFMVNNNALKYYWSRVYNISLYYRHQYSKMIELNSDFIDSYITLVEQLYMISETFCLKINFMENNQPIIKLALYC